MDGDDAASDQQPVVEEGGEAFEEPEHFGRLFVLQVVVAVFGRAHRLDVPGVEVFVREEAEQLGVAGAAPVIRLGQAVARGHEQGGAAVFEAAVEVVAKVEEEGVAVHGRQSAKEHDGFAADGLHVAAQAFVVVVPAAAADDDVVRHTAGGEGKDGQFVGEHEGGVNHLVVVIEPVGAVAVGLRPRHLPAGAVSFQRKDETLRQVFHPFNGEAGAAGVQDAALVVEVAAAHADVARVDAVCDEEFVAVFGNAHPPARGRFEAMRDEGAALVAHGETREQAGKVAAHVAARYPYRQVEDDFTRCRHRHTLLHVEAVSAGRRSNLERDNGS